MYLLCNKYYILAGGKGIHRPLDNNSGKGKINKQMQSRKPQKDSLGSNNKNKGKKTNKNIRPFSYTAFNNYGASNKKKRKRN